MPQAARDKIVSEIALGRCGTPEDIARAAMFYICEAPYVTGQILAVDGGRSLGW
jgi:pteridine reductase